MICNVIIRRHQLTDSVNGWTLHISDNHLIISFIFCDFEMNDTALKTKLSTYLNREDVYSRIRSRLLERSTMQTEPISAAVTNVL